MAPPPQNPKSIPSYMDFVIGGLSGMMAICIVQPADMVKTRMQLMGAAGRHMSTFKMASEIQKNEGFKGFYKGLTAAIFKQATYTTGRLGCFNALLDWHKETHGMPSFPVKILLGMGAGGVGAFIGNPAEITLIRMTADGSLPPKKRRNYRNVFNAIARFERVSREEGVSTLWRGAIATVIRSMVVNGAQLGSYAEARESLLLLMSDGVMLHFAASMIAGLVSSAASLPVDIVKTRVQNATKAASPVSVATGIIKNEGFLALWSGFLPTYVKIGPYTVFSFIFMEQLNRLYLRIV